MIPQLAYLPFILVACQLVLVHGRSIIVETREVTNTSKAGLAWPNAQWININQYRSTGKVSWYYSWSPSSFDTDLEFVPMFWGTKDIDQWQGSINQTIARRNVRAVLGFNEPQESTQSNMSPQDGATLWKTYIEPLKSQGIRLGSPATSSGPSGKRWLQEWLGACAGGCTVDFIALHWYDVNATNFIAYLEDFHQTFGLNLWVTEWACQNFNDVQAQCSADDIRQFMNTTQSFMDETDYVERYAWFGAMKELPGVNANDAIMDGGGKINALGLQYIGASGSGVGQPSHAVEVLQSPIWAPLVATVAISLFSLV